VRRLGLTLLEQAILTARDAGVRRFLVVGSQAEQVARHLADLHRRHRRGITPVPCPQWPQGNGASALAVASSLQEPFLLRMADHPVEPGILRALPDRDDGHTPCLMAVARPITGWRTGRTPPGWTCGRGRCGTLARASSPSTLWR